METIHGFPVVHADGPPPIEPILLQGGPAHGHSCAVGAGAHELILPVADEDGYLGARYMRTDLRSRADRPIFHYVRPAKKGGKR